MESEATVQDLKKEVQEKKTGDMYIWGIFIALCVISLVESYSASSREVLTFGIYYPIIKHGAMLLVGAVVVYSIQHFSYQKFIWTIPLLAVITILVMIYVMVAGDEINGAKRAINLPGFTLQPAEMAKLVIVLDRKSVV